MERLSAICQIWPPLGFHGAAVRRGRKAQGRRLCAMAKFGGPHSSGVSAQRQLAVQTQLFNDIPCETGFQFFKGHAAIPTDTRLIVNVGRKDMGFGKAEVLVVSSALVASIAAAGTKEWKQVAHKIVVEVENDTGRKTSP